MRGLSRALGGSSKALGGPLGSGVSTASFETAHEDALSRLASGQDDQLQTDTKGTAIVNTHLGHHVCMGEPKAPHKQGGTIKT